MSNEVKLRKKNLAPKQSGDLSETNGKAAEEEAKTELKNGGKIKATESLLDVKTCLCLLSLVLCAILTWVVLQQDERFCELEKKYHLLHEKTTELFNMEEEVVKVSEKCRSVQVMLEGVAGQRTAVRPQLEALKGDVSQLSEWASDLTEKRSHLQASLAALTTAVGQIEERTAAITKDMSNKVASVKTDVRRMEGLQSEVESMLAQVGELEDRMAQAERTMVKRIGDVLAGSIDRVSSLRESSEKNGRAIDKLQQRIPELATADRQISERLRELESGRARLIRTVTFAGDLKPKVATIKRDFAMLEPQLSDLTLRIGQLAEDLAKREQDISELRQTLANQDAVEHDLGDTSKQEKLSDNPDVDLLLKADLSKEFVQTNTHGE